MEYIFHIAFMLNIYILLVLSTNVTVMANLLTLCQAAFYGIGAYIATFFLLQFKLPILVVAMLVMGFSGLCSLLITLASVKLKGDYFILATLGFQMILYTVLYNWTEVTNRLLHDKQLLAHCLRFSWCTASPNPSRKRILR